MTEGLEARVGNRNRRIDEAKLAAGAIALGAILALADEIFAATPVYRLLAFVMPAAAWGLMLTSIGIVRLVTLVVNGVWPTGPHVRWALSGLCLAFVWLPLAASYFLSAHETALLPGLVLAPLVAVGEANCFYSLSVIRARRRRER